MNARLYCLALVGCAATLPNVSLAQPVAIVRQGDLVAGVGLITRIDRVAVNNAGSWLVEADTDHADSSADTVVLRDGQLVFREGQLLPDPPGARIVAFDSLGQNRYADIGWNLTVSGTVNDTGVFFDGVLLMQEGDFAAAPQFGAGTRYTAFLGAALNDYNGLLVVATVDDPTIPTATDRAILRVRYDPMTHRFSEWVLVKEGDVLPGQTEPVADLGTGQHDYGFSGGGSTLFFADLTGDTSRDGVIYQDDTLVAQEGAPSPVPGRTYLTLADRGKGVSGLGYVFKATLSGDAASDQIIVRNGATFMQEGDTLAAIAPYLLQNFGAQTTGPVCISEFNEVLWFGDWNEPATARDTGLFVGTRLLLREGVTTVGGLTLFSINSGPDGFAMSPSGRWIISRTQLTAGTQIAAAVLVDAGGCRLDWNQDGVPNSQDVFDFLTDFFAGQADFTGDGVTNSQDFIDYVAQVFLGCE